MKLTLNRKELLEALQIVTKAAPSKQTLPILNGIFMQTKDGMLELCCTDLEFSSRVGIPCEGDLLTVAPAKMLLEIVKMLPGDVEITHEVKDASSTLYISSGKTKYTLQTMSESEFPLFPTIEGQSFEIDSQTFRNLVSSVVHAVGQDGTRPFLSGVYFKLADGAITAVGTDTFRLALATEKINLEGTMEAIIPPKALQEASKLVGMIRITMMPNQVAFECYNVTFVTRLIDGQFVNYQRVINDDFAAKVKVQRKPFIEAVERVSVLAKDQLGAISLSLADGLTIEASAPETGTARETIEAEAEGTRDSIHCRHKFLLEALNAINEPEVLLCLPAAWGPIQMIPLGGIKWRQLIMPVTATD
jgi:DNA polymerase-3 subunit beta